MTQEEYIASILALANEAVRIKDNKPYFFDKNKTVPRWDSLKNTDGNSPNSAENSTDENPLSESIFLNCPIMVFDETLPDFFFSLFGRRWKSSLTSIRTLVELFKNRTSTKEVTILYLPTRCKYLTDIFGNHKQVSRTIQRCLKVGLLKCVNDKFRFGEYNSYSKQYAWNKKAERLILDYCKECGIKASIPHSVTMKWAIDHFGENDGWKIKAEGLNIDIVPQTALPKELTNEEVVEAILVRYPQIKDAMVTAIRLNRNLPEEEQISVVPTIQRSKSGTITKIGFRITNPIVSAKVHDNQNDDYHGIWLKRDVLEPKFGKWAEYDVKGSIYRVAHFLSFHEWLPDTIDPYEEMAGFKFDTKEERNHFKYLSMQLYFENSAASQLSHYVLKGLDESFQDKNYIVPVIEEARWRQRQFCGESIRSKIFIHESCIYMEAFRRMVEEKGWRVIQVYDGFYIKDGNEETAREARKIVEESAYWYLERYYGVRKPVEAQEAPSSSVPVCPTEKPVERAEDPSEVKESTEEEVRARLYAANTKKMDLSRWQKQLDSWQKANGVATKPIDRTSLVDIGGKVAEAFGASFGVSQTKTWRDATHDDLKGWNETLNPSTGSTTKSWKDVSPDCLKRWEREIQDESETKVDWASDETAARIELWMLDA